MGKFATALLITALQLCAVDRVRGDEQVLRLQEELRKRHLFFGNPNGEFSPALVMALSRYQNKKGFPATGLLDLETCASLGISPPGPRVAPTPFVVVKTGDVRGVNGELLPSATPLFAIATGPASPRDARPLDDNAPAPALLNKPQEEIRPAGKGTRERAATPGLRQKPRPRETNPLVLAYQSVDHALKLVFRDAQPRKKRDPKKRG
jgi:peptidoglycan hydrolase-like protein with peptidoglycan-binding domain